MIDDDVPPGLRLAHLAGAIGLLALLLLGAGWFAASTLPFLFEARLVLAEFGMKVGVAILLGDLRELVMLSGAQITAADGLRDGRQAILALSAIGLVVTMFVTVWLAALRLSLVWMISGLPYFQQDQTLQELPAEFADPRGIAALITSKQIEVIRLSRAERLLTGPMGAFLRPGHRAMVRRLMRPGSTLITALVRPVFYGAVTLAVAAILTMTLQVALPDPGAALLALIRLLSRDALWPILVWTGLFVVVGVLTALLDLLFMRALLPQVAPQADYQGDPVAQIRRIGSLDQLKQQLEAEFSGSGQSLVLRHHILSDDQSGRDSFVDHGDVRLTVLVEGNGTISDDEASRAARLRAFAGVAFILLSVVVVFFVAPPRLVIDLLAGQPVAVSGAFPAMLHLVLSLGLARRLLVTGRRYLADGAEVLDQTRHETPLALVQLVGTLGRNRMRDRSERGNAEFEQEGQTLSLGVSLASTTLTSHSRTAGGPRQPWSRTPDHASRTLAAWLRTVMLVGPAGDSHTDLLTDPRRVPQIDAAAVPDPLIMPDAVLNRGDR